ncbi:unannotated protein [freshwater metagenome]|uniref:Unannotated protein n=1 Tax=freshwater metagenome TaxID=449393 RepID=A0A6J6ABE9_9ZZZZ
MSRSSAASGGRRRVWLTLVTTTLLSALWVAAWGLQQWAPFDHEPAATTWPANIHDLATFVEHATQQKFLHVVPVEYIVDHAAFTTRVAPPEVTQADRHVAATQDAVGRALGLWNGDASTLTSSAALETAPSWARWLRTEDVLVVRATTAGAALNAYQRSQTIVQLTIALDEQHHHLGQRRIDSTTRQQSQALGVIGIGHAVWVHDLYYDHLSPEEQAAYSDESQVGQDDYDAAVAAVPPAFSALRLVGQHLGPTFVTSVLTYGQAALDDAFGSYAPVALDEVSLPMHKFFRPDQAEHVDAPPVPWQATQEFSTQAGPFVVFLMASSGLSANDALTASDGWGNDAYTVYRLDGRVCLDLHVVADTTADADALEHAFNAWAEHRPTEAHALVGRKGNSMYVSVCDPGTKVEQSIPDANIIDQYFGRSDMIRQQVKNGVGAGTAECVASTFFGRYSMPDMRSGEIKVDVGGQVQAIIAECRSAQ